MRGSAPAKIARAALCVLALTASCPFLGAVVAFCSPSSCESRNSHFQHLGQPGAWRGELSKTRYRIWPHGNMRGSTQCMFGLLQLHPQRKRSLETCACCFLPLTLGCCCPLFRHKSQQLLPTPRSARGVKRGLSKTCYRKILAKSDYQLCYLVCAYDLKCCCSSTALKSKVPPAPASRAGSQNQRLATPSPQLCKILQNKSFLWWRHERPFQKPSQKHGRPPVIARGETTLDHLCDLGGASRGDAFGKRCASSW